MILLLYLLAIIIANVVTAAFMPLQLGPLLIPYGTWFIGITLVLRDLIQHKYGRKTAYLAIGGALVLSALTSKMLGDTLAITLASAVSFLISESADTEIYTRFKANFLKRVLASGVISGFLDSVIFIILGLSPLISGFLPWALVPGAIIGQFTIKTFMQVVGVGFLYMSRNKWEVGTGERKGD